MTAYGPAAALVAALGLAFSAAAQQWRESERDDKQAERQEWFYSQRAYPVGVIPAGARLNAIRRLEQIDSAARRQHQAAAIAGSASHAITMDSANWTLIGPKPTGAGSSYVTSGRVNAIAIDPRDNNVVYIGAAEGGIWKTTDGGATWTPLTDDQPSLATGAIALDPNNPDTVYVGTGEENFAYDSYYGAGILKSTDGGATWTNIVGPFLRDYIGALAVHPTNGNILLCTSRMGVWRSADAGNTWTSMLTGVPGISVLFDPTDGSSAYATLGSPATGGNSKDGVYHSTDGGLTWTPSNGAGTTALPNHNVGRVEIAMAPSNPATIYAQVQEATSASFGALLGIHKTTDGGITWNPLPVSNLSQWGGQLSTLIHVDFHALAFTPDGSKLYLANDGGVYSTTSVAARTVNWTELNDTLAITQFYPGMAIDPTNPQMALGGTQDNSTERYSGGLSWQDVACGDGAYTVFDPAFPALAYASCGVVSGVSIERSLGVTGNGAWVPANYGIDQTDLSPFIGPLAMDPSNPQTLYFGTYRLYQSVDSAGRWNAISPDLTGGQRGTLRAIAVAPSDSGTVYIGTSNSKVQTTSDAADGSSASWTDRSAGLPARTVTHIAVDPLDAATTYAVYSGFNGGTDRLGHVFKTSNGGANWADISGNLPNIPVNDIVVDPDLPQTLYIATDAGVMVTTDGGATWSSLGNGLPRVVVLSLVLHRSSRVLRAGTHGRGVWDILAPLPAVSLQPSIVALAPTSANPGGPAFTLSVTGSNFNGGTVIRWNGQSRPTTFVDGSHVTARIPATDIAAPGRASVLAFNAGSGGGASNSAGFLIGSAPLATAQSIVSAAYPLGGSALAPRSLATIYGVNLAPQAQVADLGPPWPFTLAGTTLTILSGAQTVPLYSVSPTQINFQVPQVQLGTQSLTITQGVQSITIPVQVVAYKPAIFTTNEQGSGQAAVLIANTASITAPVGMFPGSRPAKIGEYISIFCTGLGDVTNRPTLGSASPANPLASTLANPTVTIGGVQAKVSFSGLAPGYVGLYQVNVLVPDATPAGASVPLVLSIGGVTSNTAEIAIDPAQ